MQIKTNVSLKAHNSFGFDVKTNFLIEINDFADLTNAFLFIKNNNLPFSQDFAGAIIKLNFAKINHISKEQIEVEAGVIWHDLVTWSLANNLYGLENLAQIPGTVGAAPVQNIGAYGSEFADVCTSVTVFEVKTGEIYQILAKDCKFSYRDSIFKQNLGKWLILKVKLNLKSEFKPNLNYQALRNCFVNSSMITAQNIVDEVSKIRMQKLPNPKVLGNAGSFFHNPIISKNKALELNQRYKNPPIYPQKDGKFKVAAGWLIEKCGFKGVRYLDVGVHKDQALVLINYGAKNGLQILELANQIQTKVFEEFTIKLKIEPLII